MASCHECYYKQYYRIHLINFELLINLQYSKAYFMKQTQMKGEKISLPQRISDMLRKKIIVLPRQQNKSLEVEQLETYTRDDYQQIQVSQVSILNRIVGGVVISKNESSKQLFLHLTLLYDGPKNMNINNHRFTASMKDYELKADLSIFGYLNNFKDIQIGTFINAWVRRVYQKQNKNIYELHLNRQQDTKSLSVKLGVIQDNITIPSSILKVYEKQQMLPMNFLTLYQNGFENPGLVKIFEKGLKISPFGSLHKVSNIEALKKLGYKYQRIRYHQDKVWRDQHLELGIECIKESRYDLAIQLFNISLKFGPELIDTRIAKGCAFANMNNINQAIKQIKQALKMDPNNQQARKYYQQFQKKLIAKDEKQIKSKKRPISSTFELTFKK